MNSKHLVSLISLTVFSILELFLLDKFIRKNEKHASRSAIAAPLFLWLIFALSYFYKFVIPDAAYILAILSSFTNSYLGYYLNLYKKSRKFDRIQHAFGSFSAAIFFYFLLGNILEYGGSKAFGAFYVLLLGVFCGTVHEIAEFISDLKDEDKMQRGLRDTNFDMVSNVIGSAFACAAGFFVFL